MPVNTDEHHGQQQCHGDAQKCKKRSRSAGQAEHADQQQEYTYIIGKYVA